MTNINNATWKYLDNHLEIKKNLADGLINVSSLARKIGDEIGLTKNKDAIISAIRRYENNVERKNMYKKVYDALKKSNFKSQSKLITIVVKRSSKNETKAGSLYEKLELQRDSTLRTFEMTNYIKILSDECFLKDIKKIFGDLEIIELKKDFGEISINFEVDGGDVLGLLNIVASEFAMNDILIEDYMASYKELIVTMKEADLKRAFNLVHKLTEN